SGPSGGRAARDGRSWSSAYNPLFLLLRRRGIVPFRPRLSTYRETVTIYLRLLKIYRVALRYRLVELLGGRGGGLVSFLLLPLLLLVRRRAPHRDLPRGRRRRVALGELGRSYIRSGLLLPTRRDVIPGDIADELAFLQDQVPPFPGEQATAL